MYTFTPSTKLPFSLLIKKLFVHVIRCIPMQPDLGTRQFFSFATMTTRQFNRASMIRKKLKNVKGLVSVNGVAARNIDVVQ